MIICPACKSEMEYRSGEKNGREYEFYGCSSYPRCHETLEMNEYHLYDDGVKQRKEELSIEEEGDHLRGVLLKEGYDWEEASYAKHMWEKD